MSTKGDTKYENSIAALTVLWHVDLAVNGEELEALALALEFGGELLGRDLGQLGFIISDLLHVCVVHFHSKLRNSIIERIHGHIKVSRSRIELL